MNNYKHTQRGKLILVVLGAMALVFVAAGLTIFWPLLIGVPLLLLAAWMFHSLTIEVLGGELRWRFGPGLIRRSIPLSDLASARPVRTNFIEGWGIHYSRFGWLYNVSGNDAVAIELKRGKPLALGTDEPQALIEAINRAASVRGETPP